MMDGFGPTRFIGDFIFGFGTLFAIINPYGLAFVFLDRTMGLSEAERRRIARRIAINALIVLLTSLFLGSTILQFFGISVPALRLAGGVVVAHAGWTMLNEAPNEAGDGSRTTGDFESVQRSAFFPLTIPLTTGPGTIAAAIALGAGRSHDIENFLLSTVVSLFMAAAMALTILNAYSGAGFMARVVGAEGTRVVTRLSAFALLCVGVEIMLIGASDAIRPLLTLR